LDLAIAAHESSASFDAIIADAAMVDATGHDILAVLTGDARLSRTKVLLTKPLVWNGDAEALFRRGAQALLNKPVRERQLRSALASAFNAVAPLHADSGPMLPKVTEGTGSVDLGLNVLLAEDNPVNIEVAREYLIALGCRVTVAETGREAILACDKDQFDVILMDCQMPEMDGLTATRFIRDRERALGLGRIPIIAVTANAYEEDRDRSLAAGMDDFLVKPFPEEQLGKMLAHWTRRSTTETTTVAKLADEPRAVSQPTSIAARKTMADGTQGIWQDRKNNSGKRPNKRAKR
jgi:CheY-like chemotaxis protein